MTGGRARPGSSVALAFAAAATTWVACWSWTGFTAAPGRFLYPLLLVAVVVAGAGALGRWARVPLPVVVLGQLALVAAVTSLVLTGSPVPVGAAWGELRATLDAAMAAAQRYPSPVPLVRDGVHPLLLLGGAGCLLLVDLLACTLRRVPLAGLPLLAVYSVPVSMLAGGVAWWIFALVAAGFLLMVYLQVSDRLARWGRALETSEEAADPAGFGVRTGAVRASAGTIGAASTALAVVLPVFLPTLDLSVFDFGEGPGGGDIAIDNPMVDLRRDLQRGDDVPLVRVRTDDPDPSYLRVAVLNRFSDNEWSSGDRQVPTHQLADGEMPPLTGVAGTLARREYRYDVSVTTGFRSSWLPTQAPISAIRAPGDWRYDVRTMDFLAGGDLTTAGLSYTMTGVDIDHDPVAMARAPSSGGQVDEEFLDLPDGFPAAVRNLAFAVTRDRASRFEQAQALQRWFRRDGGFRYDLDVDPGNGTDDLVRFVSDGEGGRTGYCEQFAAAMAAMARALGIPARVAVGFLQPVRIGQDTYEYSAWDMHAWPELYFPGSGWVRFEPTPPDRAAGVPGYTTADVPRVDEPSLPAAPQPSELAPDRGQSPTPDAADQQAEDEGSGQDAGGFPWLPVGGAAAGLLALGLLVLPRTVRARRTRSRLGADPEAAWRELRDTAVDLRLGWPDHRSPRETAAWLVRHLGEPIPEEEWERPPSGSGVAPQAEAALDRLVAAVERWRYARSGSAEEVDLHEEVETVAAALRAGASRSARRRATWWPASVLSRGGRSPRSRATTLTVRRGAVVDHVG